MSNASKKDGNSTGSVRESGEKSAEAREKLEDREFDEREKAMRQEPEDKRAAARQTTPAGKGRSQ
jgi:hypothetical protein